MRIDDLQDISGNAPEKGQVLAYFRDEVLFQGYDSINSVKDLCKGKVLLEIHLFNADKEYRAVSSTGNVGSKTGGTIEYTADFAYNPSSVFIEKMALDMDPGTTDRVVTVLNHLTYDQDGMASVDDYRMIMGGIR